MTKDVFYLLFSLVSLGVLIPISLSFNKNIHPFFKVSFFLLLPIVEVILSRKAIIKAEYFDIDFLDARQIYLGAFLIILGLSSTLIVVLVQEVNSTMKLVIRLTALAIFSFIVVWSLVSF